jgi:hypothetical protein
VGHGRVRVISVALVGLLALAGCGSTSPRKVQRAELRFEAGVATLDVPLSDRELPAPVVTDRSVVVYGGRERSSPTPKGDGAVYDLERRVWTPMARAPVDAPLLYASGV